MIFISGIVSGRRGPINRKQLAKPNGGFTYLIENPLRQCGQTARNDFRLKMDILKGIAINFSKVRNEDDLAALFTTALVQIFPGSESLLLVKKGKTYQEIAAFGEQLEFEKLDLSAPDSIVRRAGEAPVIQRRVIYFPDLTTDKIFLASKFDQVQGDRLEENKHELEEGTLKSSALKIDLTAIKRAKLPAVAASPLLEYPQFDPCGAIVLAGDKQFLNPFTDLIVLREFADAIAKTMARLTV